jgi:hypothetical protein
MQLESQTLDACPVLNYDLGNARPTNLFRTALATASAAPPLTVG